MASNPDMQGTKTYTRTPSIVVSFVIEDFEKEIRRCEQGKGLTSSPFQLNGKSLHLTVCPNGQKDSLPNHISIFIQNDADEEVNISANVSVGLESSRFESQAIEKRTGFGWKDFMEHKDLDGKTFTLTVEVSMTGGQTLVLKPQSKSKQQTSITKQIFDDMSNPDFRISCSDEDIPCHKLFLAAATPVFKAMIETQMMESETGSFKITCSPSVGQNLIRFIYTGEMDPSVLEEDVEVFLELGEMFQMKNLKDYAEQKMSLMLPTSEMLMAVSFFLAGDLYRADKIRQNAKDYLKDNIKKLREVSEWKSAFGEKKELIIELLEYCF